MPILAFFAIAMGKFTGGVYFDPPHSNDRLASWAGYRTIANKDGVLTFVGSDDGNTFWSVPGELKQGKVKVDFSPKGGPADFSGELRENENISWKDKNVWEQMPIPARQAALNTVAERNARAINASGSALPGGVYFDPPHSNDRSASWAGYRMIANKDGVLTFVGSDDGNAFWSVPGELKQGKVIKVDFSPKGGPADFSGELRENGNILWKDENVWERMPIPPGRLSPVARATRS